jgi:hypothetical protein
MIEGNAASFSFDHAHLVRVSCSADCHILWMKPECLLDQTPRLRDRARAALLPMFRDLR